MQLLQILLDSERADTTDESVASSSEMDSQLAIPNVHFACNKLV